MKSISVYLSCFLLLLSINSPYFVHVAQPNQADMDSYVLYFSTYDGVYEITFSNGVPQRPVIVASIEDAIFIFSHDNQKVAYIIENQVFMSNLQTWDPQRISPEDLNVISFRWSPDDSRLIIITDTSEVDVTEPTRDWQTFSYSVGDNSLEAWMWGYCNQIVRNLNSFHFALVCSPDSWMSEASDELATIGWDGNIDEYIPEEYQLLISDIRNTTPHHWISANNVEYLVFTDIASGPVLYDIYYSDSIGTLQSVVRTRSPSAQIRISPNGRYLAYLESCDYYEPRYCLSVFDLVSNDYVINNDDLFWRPSIDNMIWIEGGSSIVLLVNDEVSRRSGIYILNISTGLIQDISSIIPPEIRVLNIAVTSSQ